MHRNHTRWFVALPCVLLLAAQSAAGHVTMRPRYSPPGESDTYTVRVPTERQSATVRLEAEFPSEVVVEDFEPESGWTVETKKNADGKVIGVVWSGGSIPPGESMQFHFTVRNPTQETTLVWKMVQIHADGSRAEWAPNTIVGAPSSGAE